MTNPLLQKYEEIYGKKEEPKPQKTHTEKLKELRDTSTIPVSKIKSYDTDDLKECFIKTAFEVKTGIAQIISMNMDMDYSCRTRRITFEVWDNL
jgi:predicted SAM-dependent methyltransferase